MNQHGRLVAGPLRSVASAALVVGLVLGGVTGSAYAGSGPPGGDPLTAITDAPLGAADQAALDDAAAQVLATPPAPGGAGPAVPGLWVGVWDPERGSVVKAYGSAAVGGPAATTDDSFRIGSVTKVFTAAAVLGLVADGELELSGTVKQYLPDLAARYPKLAKITVKQLLAMRSGIPDYANVPEDGVVPKVVADPAKVWSADELIGIGVDAGVRPGRPGYSTTNYLILGKIAEAVTGTPIEDLITQRVTEPLGLERTVLPPPESTEAPQPQTRGYVTDPEELRDEGADLAPGTDTTDWNSWGQAGGGMWSTIGGLGAFAASDFGSSLLPKKLAATRTRTTKLPEGPRYGLGIARFGPWVGHEGEALGYEVWALRNTETGAVYVGAVNACCGTASFAAVAPLLALYPDDAKYFVK